MHKRRCTWLSWPVVVVSLVLGLEPRTGQADSEKDISEDVWKRTHRVFAYSAARQARYPSLARNRKGRLILLFTRVSKEQEEAGRGPVMMIQSGDKGESWSAPAKVYEGKWGEPRTMGTLTALTSGKLVAAVAEIGKGLEVKLVRLLGSDDDSLVAESTQSTGCQR